MENKNEREKMTHLMASFISYVSKKLPDDVEKKLAELRKVETGDLASTIYDTMAKNQQLAWDLNRPCCQDTGVLQFWVKCGTKFPLIDELESLLKDAVVESTFSMPLRHNSVETFDEYNTGRNVGKTCRAHYRGTFNDGTQFDSSYDRGEPLEFVCGAGQMILGFDKAVADMEVGQAVDVHLMPEEAYGMPDPSAIFSVEIAQLPGSEELEAGQQVYLSNQFGQPFPVKVVEKDEKMITFDANHEMAGKELNFRIELVEVLEG